MGKFKYLIILSIIVALGLIAGIILILNNNSGNLWDIAQNREIRQTYDLPITSHNLMDSREAVSTSNDVGGESIVSSNINHANIPFTPQAPFGEWHDPVFDGACEEASITMVMHWALNNEKSLTPDYAKEKIQSLADFQKDNYGYFYDTSAADTVKIIKKYYNYDGVSLSYDISTEDIKRELERGNILIVPINGQILKNPFYTQPGPVAHMIVILGYDEATGEFITHDPGTKRGENFRYSEDILQNSLQDYPTGYYEAITNIRSAMIVIARQ